MVNYLEVNNSFSFPPEHGYCDKTDVYYFYFKFQWAESPNCDLHYELHLTIDLFLKGIMGQTCNAIE